LALIEDIRETRLIISMRENHTAKNATDSTDYVSFY